jgi:hypothetical protein
MRYRLRTLLIVLALGPPMVAWVWLTANQDYGLDILAASALLLILIALPVIAVAALVARGRYLVEYERRQRHRSGLFGDNWPHP